MFFFALIVTIQNNLRGSRFHVRIIEENVIEMIQPAYQLRNIHNNITIQTIQNIQNNQNNLLSDSENNDKMEIDLFY
jgi:hypothetical protein